MSEELKPCPFCGGKGEYQEDGPYAWAECLTCGATGKTFLFLPAPNDGGRKAVIKDWNTRPVEDALQGRIAELETLLALSGQPPAQVVTYAATELPDYNPNGTANPKGDASYWRARAERAEAALAAEMPGIQEVNQLYERILELEKREVELEGELKQSIYTNSIMRDQMRRMDEEIQSYAACLAAEKDANRWIPVGERLPEQGTRVLVNINGTVKIAKYWHASTQWETDDGLYYHGDTLGDVTNWQPLDEDGEG